MSSPEITRRQHVSRSTGKLLRRLVQGFQLNLDAALKEHGITAAQVRLLHQTRERPNVTGAQLARALHVTPQSVQAMLARAVAQRWIIRGADPENARLVILRLTPAGARVLLRADQIARELEARVWTGITMGEMQTLDGILERARNNLGE